jgi:hypothetical protein
MFERLRYGKQYGYEMLFRRQPRVATGKTGVLIGEMGMPDAYEFEFYRNFMQHVFEYVLPPVVRSLVLADRGVALIDPERPLAREAFKPRRLIDARGSFVNKAGVPYVNCEVEWKGPNPRNPADHGYFLYRGEGRNGEPDVCEKIGAKVVGWYYGSLIPEGKVAWRSQLRKVYDESVAEISSRYGISEFRSVYYMIPETLERGVAELIAAGCETIVYQGLSCPVYSDFEDYQHTLPLLHQYARGRAQVIMADQLGNRPAMRAAYCAILRDRLAELPKDASVLVILSRHGHPFKKETQDVRKHLYTVPLEEDVRKILDERGGRTGIVWSFDEYADEFWDPKRTKFPTHDAYRKAIDEGWDRAVELPTDFLAENTDLMIFHAIKKFPAFPAYDPYQPVPYPDWEKPLVRSFTEGKTTGTYAGCPVGPYRKYVVQAVVESVGCVLEPTDGAGSPAASGGRT